MDIIFNSTYIPDKYSKYASESFLYNNQPVVSFPFEITNVDPKVKFFCFTLIDYDAIPVCGFAWIHWIVANVPVNCFNIIEDFSRIQNDSNIIQGINSFASIFVGETDINITQRYVGPTPPDKDHDYKLTVYGLTQKVELYDGFYLNDLYKQIENIVVEKTFINLKARV